MNFVGLGDLLFFGSARVGAAARLALLSGFLGASSGFSFCLSHNNSFIYYSYVYNSTDCKNKQELI